MTLNRQYGYDPDTVSHGEHFIQFASTVENFKKVFLEVYPAWKQLLDMGVEAEYNTFRVQHVHWMKAMGFTETEVRAIFNFLLTISGVSGSRQGLCNVSFNILIPQHTVGGCLPMY